MFQKLKRLLALVLTVCMVAGVLPADVYAASMTEPAISAQVEENNEIAESILETVVETEEDMEISEEADTSSTEESESTGDLISNEPSEEVLAKENTAEIENLISETTDTVEDSANETIEESKIENDTSEETLDEPAAEEKNAVEEEEILEVTETKAQKESNLTVLNNENEEELFPERSLVQVFSEEDIVYGDSEGITRAEWLHNLVTMFALSVTSENFPDKYYPDLNEEHEYYYDVLSAIEHGLVNVEAGNNFEPDAVATREFASSTLNYYLGIQLEDSNYTFADVEECLEPSNAQIALNRGWMSLINGEFVPSQPVSSDEVTAMIEDAKELFAGTIVDEEYDSQYLFADYVVVFPETATVIIDEEQVTISDTTQTVEAGDTFVVWPTELPCIYLAEEVTATDSGIVITTAEADVDSALLDVDASGSTEVDLSNFEGADGFEIDYVETQAEAASLVQTYGISVTKDSVVASKDFTIGEGLDVTFVCNLSDLKFNHNILSKNNFYVSVTGNYTVSSSVTLDAIAAANGSSSIVIGYATVAGIGKVTISVELALEGEITYTYSGYFEAGVQKNGSSVSLKKSFQKTGFTCDIEVNASVGIKVEFAIDVFVAKGSVFASTGISAKFVSHDFNDGTLPNNCSNLSGWWYVKVGARATLGIKPLAKDFSETINIYDEKNSPVKLNFHFEDGVKVYTCTRGNQKYFTYADSKYGSSSYLGGSSTGVGSDGNTYTIYTYSLDADENAIITGYKGNASAISIPSTIDGYTVTAIGNNVFKGNSRITVVAIPNTVSKIKSNAFEECKNLRHVQMADSVTEIETAAFSKCEKLQRIYLSKNIECIENKAFYNCDSLTEIEIPKSLMTAGSESITGSYTNSGAFHSCSGLKQIKYEQGTTAIASYLFANCDGLEKVEIPSTATEVKKSAFYNCNNLKEVVLKENLIKIGISAFAKCSELEKIEIPNTVVTLNELAFSECTRLKEVWLSAELTSIGNKAFYNCDSLIEIEIPKSLMTAGSESITGSYTNSGAFHSCSGLKQIKFEQGTIAIASYLFASCDGLEKVEIPATATEVKKCAFYNCNNLKEVVLKENLIKIGTSAFAKCSELEEIKIPNTVVTLNELAFSECIRLKEVQLSTELTSIGNKAFYNCDSLIEIEIPKSLMTAGSESITGSYTNSGAFHSCSGLKQIKFEQGTTKIKNILFASCDGIEKIELPETISVIENYAFYNCINLKEIKLSKNIKEINTNAFRNCISLETVYLLENVECFGENVFYGCSNLKNVQLSDKISTIQQYMFYDCRALEKITIPKSIGSIGEHAFENCSNLKTVNLGENITDIGNNAFRNCDALETITVPNAVSSLGNNVFYDCDLLTEVSLGTGITSIPSSTFEHCDVLESIVLPYRVASIGANAFKDSTKFTTITIPRATTSIDSTAFSYPAKMTIYGVAGTYAETFANEKGIKFVDQTIPATKVELNKTELILNKGASDILKMSVTPANFTDEVTWKCTNTNVVTISQDGTVKAVGSGTATVKITVGNVSASCKVTVVQPVTSLSLNKTSVSLEGGESYQLTCTVNPSDAYNKEIAWTSSDESIATIENGLVKAKSKGTAIITVSALDGSGKTKTCTVNVTNNVFEITNTEGFESTHPYESNCKDSWVYEVENAEQISITFAQETMLEEGFDYLYIYDEAGVEIGKYTGCELSGQTITVDGAKIRVKLYTDSSGSEYGFKVDNIFVNKGQKVSVTFDSQGGTNVETITGLKVGSTVTIPKAPTREGYVFKGWYTKPEGQGDKIVNSIVVKEDMTVYAAWEKIITYTIIFDSQGGESVEAIENILPGTRIDLPIITIDSDLHFSGWYTEPNGQGDFYFESLTINSDITLYAYWTENPTYAGYMVEAIQDQAYTGKALKPEIKVYDNNILLTLGQDYTLSYKNNTKVGTAQVIVKGKGNYTKTMTIEFVIVPKSLADDDIQITCADKLYNGKKQVSKPTIKWGKKTLKSGTDYTVTYSADQISAGVVNVTIEGKGNYGGIVETSYRITDKDISKVLLDKIVAQYYTGDEIAPEILLYADKSTKAAGEKLVLDTDYSLVYENNVNAGKGTVTIIGLGEYGGSKKVTFTISKRNVVSEGIDVVTSTGDAISEFNGTYNGKVQKPEIVIYDNGFVLEEGKDYKLSYANTTNAATVDSKTKPTITITGLGNYTGTKKVFFNILPEDISDNEGLKIKVDDAKYTGKAVKPKVTVTYEGKTLKSSTDYKVTGYYNNVDLAEKDSVNAPYVTIEGLKNFTGTVDVNFRIYELVVSGFVIDKIPSKVYTPHEAIEPKVAVYPSKAMQTEGNRLIEGVDYEITSYEANEKAGTGKVTVTGIGQYGGSKTVTFTISKRNLLLDDISVEMLDKQMTYTGRTLKPAFRVWDKDIELTEGVDYTVTYSNNKTVSKSAKTVPTITIKGKGNYTGTIKETFEILPKDLLVEGIVVTAKDVLFSQKTANSAKGMTTTVTVMDGSKKLSTSDYKIVEYKNNRTAGDVSDADAPTVVIEGKGNYTGTVEIPFRIFKNNISKAGVAKIPNEMYTGNAIEPKPVVTLKVSKTETITLVEGKDYTISYDKNVKIGKAKVIITGMGEYGGSKSVTFTILPKWLKWFV